MYNTHELLELVNYRYFIGSIIASQILSLPVSVQSLWGIFENITVQF